MSRKQGAASRVTKDIARASDPVLSQIKAVPMKSTVCSVLETRDDLALDLPAEPVGFELGVKAEDVRDKWFAENAPQLHPGQVPVLMAERGWTDDRIARRVRPYLLENPYFSEQP